jgi:hypothetical protein
MGYYDKTLGKDARKPEAGPLGKFKGKAKGESTLNPNGVGGKGSKGTTKKSK